MPSWIWLLVLFVTVSLLALFGLKADSSWVDYVASSGFYDDLYGVIQLFALDGRLLVDGTHEVSWQLKVAAFAAPVITVFAFLQLVWRNISDAVSASFYRRFYRKHLIVIGLGQKSQIFVRDALHQSQRVIAIDIDGNAHLRVPAHFGKFRFIQGDIFGFDLVGRCGIARADAIVVFCGDDYHNISVAQHISEVIGSRIRQTERWPRIICNATSSALTNQAASDQAFADKPGPIIEFYSPEQVAARQLLVHYPPASYAHVFRRSGVHIVVYGLGELAAQVVRQAAILCQKSDAPLPKITLVIPPDQQDDSGCIFSTLALGTVCQLETIKADLEDEGFWRTVFPDIAASACEHVICLQNRHQASRLALRMRREMHLHLNTNTPIFVGTIGTKGNEISEVFGPNISSISRQYKSNLICTFGDRPSALGWHHVVAAHHDELAKQNHLNYISQLNSVDRNAGIIAKPAAVPWVQLAEPYRYSNRSFVDHLAGKLASIDCAISDGQMNTELTQDELLLLAKSEHSRWCAERIMQGWTYGKNRNDSLQQHPDLIEWKDLSNETQSYDIALVSSFDSLLDKVGKSAARVCRIGVSGHRHPGIDQSDHELVAQVSKELLLIKQAYPNHQFIITSALAEGADRLVADLAMREIDARLHVILPLPIDQYRDDFIHHSQDNACQQTEDSIKEFHRLLDQAEWACELPQLFSDQNIDASNKSAATTARQKQYALTGAYLAQHCHEMIFLWDGKPARGHGGTADIVDWRKSGNIPKEYLWDNQHSLNLKNRKPGRVIRIR